MTSSLPLAARPQQDFEGLHCDLICALLHIGEGGADGSLLVLKGVGFCQTKEALFPLDVEFAELGEGELPDRAECILIVGADLLVGIVRKGILFGAKVGRGDSDHPVLEEGLLVEQLGGGVLYLLGQDCVNVLFEAMGLVVDDLDGGVVVFEGLEVGHAHVVGEGSG